MLLKAYNTEFDEIIITFTDQKVRPLEIEVKVNLKLLFDKKVRWYSIEPRTRKYVKGNGFLSFLEKYKKEFLSTGLMLPKK